MNQKNEDLQSRRQSSKGIAQSIMLLNLRGDLSEAGSPKSRYGGDETRSNRIFTDNSGQQTYSNYHKPLIERRRNKIGTEVTGMYRMGVSAPRRSRRWSQFSERTFQFQHEILNEEKNKADKFGFIRPECIYGNEEHEGLFNYEAQARTLQEQHKQQDKNVSATRDSGNNNDNNADTDREDNFSETKHKQKQNSLLDRMADHIKATTKVQRQFLEMSMEDVKPRIKEDSKRKEEENQGKTQSEVLNKLNSHIKYIKEREVINHLTKQLSAVSNSVSSKGQPNSNLNIQKPELVNSVEGKKQSIVELSFLQRKYGKNQEDNNENILTQAKPETNAKTKMKKIIATHQNAVRDIEYVYSDVATEIKKSELLKKIHRLQDTKSKLQKIQQQRDSNDKNKRNQKKDQSEDNSIQKSSLQNNKMQNSTRDTIGFQKDKKISLSKTITSIQPTQHDDKQKESISTQFKTIGMSKTFDKGFFHPRSLIDPKDFEIPSRLRKNSANNLRQKHQTKTSVNVLCAQLETANQSLADIEKKTESENKIYFKPTYKVRERGLTFELADSENKEAVLDRVMMSYFHQQDLLEKQIDLLKKEKQNTKSSQNNIVLNEFLSKFQPAHMRLHLKDISNRVSLDSSSILSSRHKRSRTWDKPGWASDRQTNRYAEEIADGCETDIYREQYQVKKKQLKTINYQKVCSSAEMVKSFMRFDPYNRKRESIEAIDYLVQFNPGNAKNDRDNDEERDGGGSLIPNEIKEEKIETRKQDEILRRCFFKYCNKNDASTGDKYQRMNLEGFIEFFQSLSAQKSTHDTIAAAICDHQGEDEIDETKKEASLLCLNVKGIFNQIIKKKGQQVTQHSWVNFYEFLQILEKTSIQFYLKTVQQVESMPEPQKLFQRFCTEMIFPLNVNFRDPAEIELLNMAQIRHVQKVLQFFEDGIKPLFVIAGSLRSEFAPDDSSIYLQFQEVFDMLEKIQLFPIKISKVTIRYIYFYVLDLDHGLDFRSFCTFFHLLALSAVRFPLQHNSASKKGQKASIPKRKCREVQSALYNLRIDNQLNQQTQKFIEDLSVFYLEAQFLDMQNVPNKVAEIRGTVQKMLNQI